MNDEICKKIKTLKEEKIKKILIYVLSLLLVYVPIIVPLAIISAEYLATILRINFGLTLTTCIYVIILMIITSMYIEECKEDEKTFSLRDLSSRFDMITSVYFIIFAIRCLYLLFE